jgi:hypothetical protein
VFLTIPRWFRKLLLRVGLTRPNTTAGYDFADLDEFTEEDSSEPPELEDCSHLLNPVVDFPPGPSLPTGTGGAAGPSNYNELGKPVQDAPGKSGRFLDSSLFNSSDSQPGALSPGRGRTGAGRDRYVFDSVFGVIPQETRDLWLAQELDAQQRQRSLKEAQRSEGRPLPPIRFSTQF